VVEWAVDWNRNKQTPENRFPFGKNGGLRGENDQLRFLDGHADVR
jgi:hypothetical protein